MIKKWLTAWRGDAPYAEATESPFSSKPVPCPPGSANAGAPPDIDALFFRWLCGAGDQPAAPRIEQLLIDELARLAQSPGAGAELVPRVPALVPQLLTSLRDDNMSAADLSRLLSQDVVLVGEVMRGANSPFYSPRTPLNTIESAVMLLGENGMRQLLARVAFRPVIGVQAGRLARHAAPRVWRHAEKCAMAAAMVAPRLRANAFDAYLAGLMQNVGLIVALRLFDQLHPEVVLPQSPQFYAALSDHARTLSARIAQMWGFPAAVSGAIQQAAQGGPPLARALALGDRLARLRVLVDAGKLGADEQAALAGFDDELLACFAKLQAEQD